MASIHGAQFDVVIPDRNEKEFIERASALGYREILFLTSNIKYIKPRSDVMIIKTGYLLRDTSEISKSRRSFDYIFAPAERKFYEQKIDFIIDSELSGIRDSFHYRSTSLNQVHAELARKNGINIVFSFSNVLFSSINILGKMCQNAILVKKYRLKYSSFSMAKAPSEMRSRNILDSLLSVLSL